MKLCIVTHNVKKGDGQGRVNYEITWEAIRRGHHVTILASEVALELQKHPQVKWVCIPVRGWPGELLRNMIFSWQSATWLRQHQCSCDLVKVNGAITKAAEVDVNAVHFVHNSWLKFSQKAVKPKSVWTIFHPRGILYDFYQWLYTAANAYWEKKAFEQARVIVAISHQVAQELLAIGVPAERLQVILNGVDLQEFSPGTTDRSVWNLPKTVPLALFAGDIRIPRKNLDTVLQALVEVPQLHLAVAGITEGSPYIKLAASLGLSERVHFLGLCHNVPQLMKAVDFLVFPSRYEPFGLVVIEAMACGLPVITASTTGAAELVTPESGIVIADPDDRQALAQALLSLTNDRALRQKMGKTARTIAEQHSWNQMAKSYVDLFENLHKQTSLPDG